MSKEIFPVYEFRPLPDALDRWGDLYRYANGTWIPDDGEYDLAFYRGNMHMYIDPPYHRNIEWKWLTTHWTCNYPGHPGANPWHYRLRDGETKWGSAWGRDRHINYRAGNETGYHVCGLMRSANGRPIEFKLNDPHIVAGLVRRQDTKEIVVPPAEPLCMYCGLDWLR